MNRFQKVALLTNVLTGGNAEANKKRLTHVMENQARGLVLIDDLDEPYAIKGEDAIVTFTDKGKDYQMTVAEAHRYAKRNFINTLFVLPAKRPISEHEFKG